MKTLIIYDDTGYIYLQMSGMYQVPQGGIQYLETEVSEGKILKSIDISKTPHIPILEDMPKTDLEKTQNQLLETQAQLADLQEQILLKENGGM
ncbi:hypothetical protein [Clostridium saccharoperbutylacetonicum]|uniref:hypothetical protein n=1 Tax=Clostridium saccharoperbutylacetonicum TaxID=36745 RepID=UPI000983D040|nr:hypothetical protein [Clostridium saccharoperbutylacetonicum]AQR95578.1 hypothetical protein CLSAP_28940 [Clostridium saccharoperbutylacetonicum]NSB31438.1 hypothetical protein [Clostridium saccharoperbutylacetonicum]